MSNLKIKVIKDNNIELNSSKIDTYKVKSNIIANKVQDCRLELKQFKIGTKVKHKEEGILGEIKFVGFDKIAVVWQDNTRERMILSEAQETLEYVDSAQSQVSPLAPQISKEDEEENVIDNKNPEMDDMFESAIASLNDETTSDEDSEHIDIEKIKMQRKINQLENKLTVKQSNNMKEKIANDLINLAVIKGMIEKDDSQLEMTKILAMNDQQLKEYQSSIVDYETDGNVITSEVESNDIFDEAELALRKIKGNGGQPIIGDFTNKTTMSSNFSSSDEKRSLGDIKDTKFTFDNQFSVPSFGDHVVSELIDKLNNKTVISTQEKQGEVSTSLKGFENLTGLTKPLVVANKPAAAFPTNTGLKDLMSDLGWTTLKRSL